MAYSIGPKYTGIPSSTLNRELFILTHYLGDPYMWPIWEAGYPTAEQWFEGMVAFGVMIPDSVEFERLELASPAKTLFSMPY